MRSFLPLLYGLERAELDAACRALGQPRFRAGQVWSWLHAKHVDDWNGMRNVPKSVRTELAAQFDLRAGSVIDRKATADGTLKLLVELRDGERIEEVLIPAPGRRTVCVSSQAGCRFHCAFCASGQAGWQRNLATGEIVAQVLLAAADLGEHPTHVVFMGIGEPFDNTAAVLKAIRILNDSSGLDIGARRMTISTCGVVPGIRQLAAQGLQVELSVSLHAPDDALRSSLMPVNRRYPLAELMEACRRYTAQTNRIITFEYTLIHDLNDTPRHAAALADLLQPLACRVNLIPLSPVDAFEARSSELPTAEMFVRQLADRGVNATLRRSKGASLDAACGQLRYRGHGAAAAVPADS